MLFILYRKIKQSIKTSGIRMTLKKILMYLSNTGMRAEGRLYNYDCEYQNDYDYSDYKTDIKTIVFYLPQYHAIPENNEWWGEGFTDWTNVKKAVQRFPGHYQPRKPHLNIGYYDLSEPSMLRQQAALAKKHNIYGFCIYYYWFSGRRLLEKPLEILLNNKDIDINFCICWANENWTRAWDGKDKDILIEQKYRQNDAELFIKDLKNIFASSRYIRHDGKPVVVVYNPGEIPEPGYVFRTWRETAKKENIGEICIWACQISDKIAENPEITGNIDALIEFPPLNWKIGEYTINKLIPRGSGASVYDYIQVADMMIKKDVPDNTQIPLYKTSMAGWDNSARRDVKWTAFHNFSLDALYKWIKHNAGYTRKYFDENSRFMFFNAWNEWAEGTYLEPDAQHGYACINTLTRAICDIPFGGAVTAVSGETGKKEITEFNKKIAVQIHIYYPELSDTANSYINNIPYPFDLYISTDSNEKKNAIETVFNDSIAQKISIGVYPNRGRDAAPFLIQMRDIIDTYDYICHIHTKKTETAGYGDIWREYLYKNLLGSTPYVINLLSILEKNDNIGIAYPPPHPSVTHITDWGGNIKTCEALLAKMNKSIQLNTIATFPAGNMFWAKTKAISDIFKTGIDIKDFPKENGQVDATLAHAIERTWVYLARASGYEFMQAEMV